MLVDNFLTKVSVGKSNLDDTFFPIMNLSSNQVAVIYIEHNNINKKTGL